MNPQGSGFIYFPTSVAQAETSEFMAFNESPVKGLAPQNFTPRNYSSPNNQQWNKNGGNNSSRGKFRDNNRKSWQNNSFSPYKNGNNYSYTSRTYKSNGDNTFSKHKYLHPSFTEDPWAQLENKYRSRNNAEQFDVSEGNSSF